LTVSLGDVTEATAGGDRLAHLGGSPGRCGAAQHDSPDNLISLCAPLSASDAWLQIATLRGHFQYGVTFLL